MSVDEVAAPGERLVGRLIEPVVRLGDQLIFHAKVIGQIPVALRYHRAQIGRNLAEVSLGGGALIVGGGAIGVVLLLSTLTGTEVGLEGHQGLDIIGLAPLTGFISGYANTREIAPIVVALAFAARIGCGYTSRLGAMRISEEIDALEAMSIRPIAYLVSTRLLASFVMVLPLYLLGLVGTYVTTNWVVTVFFNQSAGTYEHYFTWFVSMRDVICSAIKVVVLTTIVTLVHCYHGFHATGGPEGVGRATGHAIRTSIIAITVVDILLTLLLWGPGQKVTVSG
jgi:phospholipid/cholesterol/gamma-HCH transport system permease protein